MLHAHSVLAIPGHDAHIQHVPHISIAAPHTQENWKEEYNVKDFILLLLTPKLNKYSHPLFTTVNWFLFILTLVSVIALVLATDPYLNQGRITTLLFAIDAVCVSFFTIEYGLLVYSIPDRSRLTKFSYVLNLLCMYRILSFPICSYTSILSRNYYRLVQVTKRLSLGLLHKRSNFIYCLLSPIAYHSHVQTITLEL
jgi:hypothetical protein